MERMGWFFEKWGLETNPSQKERPAGGVSLPCASKLRRKCELKRGGNGKKGDIRVRTSVVGMWEKAGNWKVLSCLYFEGTFKKEENK